MFYRAIHIVKIILIATCLLQGCYVLKQGYHQGNLLAQRESVDVLLWRGDLEKDQIEKLQQIKKILGYAKDQNLNVENAYRTIIRNRQDAVSYLVFASEKFALKAKTWRFPIVGTVPYLGFFEKQDRDQFAHELRAEGYDIYESRSEAFSSLGWFDDPIYMSMLDQETANLANLLFHELVHRSFWLEDQAAFNENLAEFLADQLTRQYLKDNRLTTELSTYNTDQEDREKYEQWIQELKKNLEMVFANEKNLSDRQLQVEKDAMYQGYCGKKLPAFETSGFKNICAKPWNNARLLAASVYFEDKEKYAKAFGCFGSKKVGDFLEKLKALAVEFRKPDVALEKICE